jgi:putative chitinase
VVAIYLTTSYRHFLPSRTWAQSVNLPQNITTMHTVSALQQQLQRLGYLHSRVDGIAGPQTRAALQAFQRSAGLAADGIAGPLTWAAFGPASAPQPVAPRGPAYMLGITDEIVCAMFPRVPAQTIRTNLPGVLYALEAAQLTTLPLVMIALATIAVETGTFEPVEEARNSTNTLHQPFDKYDNNHNLGNRGRPDGSDFRGRGYVQLTGRDNYTRFGPLVGQPDLVDHPHDATNPDIAASLLAAFFKQNETAIQLALANGRLDLVRKVINGAKENGRARFEDAYRKGMAAYREANPG